MPLMLKFGAKKEETIGLDIGNYSLKVISLDKNTDNKVLTAYNIKKISGAQNASRVEAQIKELFEEIDIQPKSVNLAVSGPEVIVRFISLPKMSREQLSSALSFEAEKYIPFSMSEVVLDFLILGDAPEAGQMNVLLAAVKRDLINKMVNMMESLGVSIDILDINAFAIFNSFMSCDLSEGDESIALLDMGHLQTDVLISSGGTPSFMRQIQIGGKNLTNAICKTMSVDPEKAEELKLSAGEQKEGVNQITMGVIDDLVREMQLSFGYFENRYNKTISGIFCSGGMTYQDCVLEYLNERLGVEVRKWNPIGQITCADTISREDLDSIAAQLSVSIGLALRV